MGGAASDRAAHSDNTDMTRRQPTTVREQIAASYAMLGRAHAALKDGRTQYTKTDHMIHAKLRKPDCCRNRKVRYYPDQAGSRFREKSVIPAKAGIQGFS